MAIWFPNYLIKTYLTHNIAENFHIYNKYIENNTIAMLTINSRPINFYIICMTYNLRKSSII